MIRRPVVMSCDVPGCRAVRDDGWLVVRPARAEARRAGWHSCPTCDVCPAHVASDTPGRSRSGLT